MIEQFEIQPLPEFDICIYHRNCRDGFGAAYAVWCHYGNETEYLPLDYHDPVPDLTDKRVLVVDFSWKRPVIEKLSNQVKYMVILDHHESAQRELADLPPVESFKVNPEHKIAARFDMNKSGCRLAWEYLSTEELPKLLAYIEDHDLFRHQLPHSLTIKAGIGTLDFNFEEWCRAIEDLDRYSSIVDSSLYQDGEVILKYKQKQIEHLVNTCTHLTNLAVLRENMDGLVPIINGLVPIINAPMTMSTELGHKMLEKYPDALFALIYQLFENGQKVRLSLRSDNKRMPVNTICEVYGGGGHRNAAGAVISLETFNKIFRYGAL